MTKYVLVSVVVNEFSVPGGIKSSCVVFLQHKLQASPKKYMNTKRLNDRKRWLLFYIKKLEALIFSEMKR